MTQPSAPAGLPGWRRANCLGCDRLIVQARHGWVSIAGTRSGSWIAAWPTRPDLVVATDPDNIPRDGVFLLGVAHPDCVDEARRRIASGDLDLPLDLPTVSMETDFEFDDGEEPALHLPSPIGRCPFCNSSTDLTAEHIWPEWYIKAVKPHGEDAQLDGIERPLRHATVDVCRRCNNEWMSVLEQDASQLLADMLRTRQTTLDPLQQQRLAAWVTLKAYELDCLSQRLTPRGYLQDLRNKRIPPHGVSVWLGAYSPDAPAHAWTRYHRISALNPGVDPVPVNAFSVTITVYQVIFQVVGHYVSGSVSVRDSSPSSQALSQIWPITQPLVSWPLPLGFSPVSVELLVNRIGD